MEETGVANVADPLGGSWYVEALTDRIEAEAEEIFDRIRRALGPATAPIDLRHPARHRGRLVHRRDRRGRLPYQRALEKGDKRVVGVNVPHRLGRPATWRSCGSATRWSASRCACWPARKAGRDDAAVRRGARRAW